MEAINTLGKFLTGDEDRDAIHMAIVPVIAGENLRPGDEVGLVYGTTNVVKRRESLYGLKSIGVIDPFLACTGDFDTWNIQEGKRVWCFLHPGSIIGLRHVWSCPAIDNVKPPANDSEKWLRNFADEWRFDYDIMISEASAHSTGAFEHFVVARGVDLHDKSELGADHDLFWSHLENLTGKKFDVAHRENFGWSCSC